MKTPQVFILLVVLLISLTFIPLRTESQVTHDEPIRLVSYNIWFDNPGNTDNPWKTRKAGVRGFLSSYAVDIACLQEALAHQVRDLEDKVYAHYGVGRDDGAQKGEFTAILYRKDRLQVLDGGNFWLSDTPGVAGSVGWDAALTRMATWVKFQDLATGQVFFVFNTHFDHVGEVARLESARLLKSRIESIAGNEPLLVAGDFNCKPASGPYAFLTKVETGKPLLDSRLLGGEHAGGPPYSFVGSDFIGKPGDIIDHVFIRGDVSVRDARIIDNCLEGVCPSDHLPVYLEFEFLSD